MDPWLSRRAADPRFQNERRVSGIFKSNWYLADERFQKASHTFSAREYKSGDSSHQMTPHVDDNKRKSKQLKRKKGSAELTEAEKKRLRTRESSDDSDSGGCWYFSTHPCGIPCHNLDPPVCYRFAGRATRVWRARRRAKRARARRSDPWAGVQPIHNGPVVNVCVRVGVNTSV